jgi:hypothetical protein
MAMFSGKSVSECGEVIDALEGEIATVEKIIADGAVNIKDGLAILSALPTIVRGVNGCWNIPAEIAGASEAERSALAARVIALLPRAWSAHVALVGILQNKPA